MLCAPKLLTTDWRKVREKTSIPKTATLKETIILKIANGESRNCTSFELLIHDAIFTKEEEY